MVMWHVKLNSIKSGTSILLQFCSPVVGVSQGMLFVLMYMYIGWESVIFTIFLYIVLKHIKAYMLQCSLQGYISRVERKTIVTQTYF